MKKIRLFFASVLLVCGIGQMKAESGSITIDANTENFPTAYGTGANDYTLLGYTFSIEQVYANNSKQLQWRAAGNQNGTGTMYNKDVFPDKISYVVIVWDGKDNNKNHTLFKGNAANPKEGTQVTGKLSSDGTATTFDCGKDCNYFVLTNGENAGYTKSVTIYYGTAAPVEKVLKSLAVSGEPAKKEYKVGNAFDPTGLTVVGTYDDASTDTIKSGITWTFSPETFSEASDNASVTVTAKVGEVSSPATTVTGIVVKAKPVLEGDVLTRESCGIDWTTTYKEWTAPVKGEKAEYIGLTAGGNEAIQMRSDVEEKKPASGIVSTVSGGTLEKVSVDWQDGTAEGRTLDVFGSKTAYTSVADLVDDAKKGELIGTIKKGESTELNVSGDYQYVGVRSHSGAMYLSAIAFKWNSSTSVGSVNADRAADVRKYISDGKVVIERNGIRYNAAGLEMK